MAAAELPAGVRDTRHAARHPPDGTADRCGDVEERRIGLCVVMPKTDAPAAVAASRGGTPAIGGPAATSGSPAEAVLVTTEVDSVGRVAGDHDRRDRVKNRRYGGSACVGHLALVVTESIRGAGAARGSRVGVAAKGSRVVWPWLVLVTESIRGAGAAEGVEGLVWL